MLSITDSWKNEGNHKEEFLDSSNNNQVFLGEYFKELNV